MDHRRKVVAVWNLVSPYFAVSVFVALAAGPWVIAVRSGTDALGLLGSGIVFGCCYAYFRVVRSAPRAQGSRARAWALGKADSLLATGSRLPAALLYFSLRAACGSGEIGRHTILTPDSTPPPDNPSKK